MCLLGPVPPVPRLCLIDWGAAMTARPSYLTDLPDGRRTGARGQSKARLGRVTPGIPGSNQGIGEQAAGTVKDSVTLNTVLLLFLVKVALAPTPTP